MWFELAQRMSSQETVGWTESLRHPWPSRGRPVCSECGTTHQAGARLPRITTPTHGVGGGPFIVIAGSLSLAPLHAGPSRPGTSTFQRLFYGRKLLNYAIVFGGYLVAGVATVISIIASGATIAYDEPEWISAAGTFFLIALGLLVFFLSLEAWSSFDQMWNDWVKVHLRA